MAEENSNDKDIIIAVADGDINYLQEQFEDNREFPFEAYIMAGRARNIEVLKFLFENEVIKPDERFIDIYHECFLDRNCAQYVVENIGTKTVNKKGMTVYKI